MINDFLSDILKVVIVLDVLGVVAYFLLGLKTKAQPSPVRATNANVGEPIKEERGLFGPGFLNPAVAASESPAYVNLAPSLGFWTRMKTRMSRKRRSLHGLPAQSLELAMGRLRGVLNGYERGLSI